MFMLYHVIANVKHPILALPPMTAHQSWAVPALHCKPNVHGIIGKRIELRPLRRGDESQRVNMSF